MTCSRIPTDSGSIGGSSGRIRRRNTPTPDTTGRPRASRTGRRAPGPAPADRRPGDGRDRAAAVEQRHRFTYRSRATTETKTVFQATSNTTASDPAQESHHVQLRHRQRRRAHRPPGSLTMSAARPRSATIISRRRRWTRSSPIPAGSEKSRCGSRPAAVSSPSGRRRRRAPGPPPAAGRSTLPGRPGRRSSARSTADGNLRRIEQQRRDAGAQTACAGHPGMVRSPHLRDRPRERFVRCRRHRLSSATARSRHIPSRGDRGPARSRRASAAGRS